MGGPMDPSGSTAIMPADMSALGNMPQANSAGYQRESYPDSCAVHVANLDDEVMPEDIHDNFLVCGEVKRITIKVDKMTGARMGFAYIDFATEEGQQNAMALDGSDFRGQTLKVSKKRGFTQENTGKGGGSCNWGAGNWSGKNKGGFGKGCCGGKGGYGPWWGGGKGGGCCGKGMWMW